MPTSIDLFSGCGGLTRGLEWAGFECLAFNELNEDAAKSFSANFPDAMCLQGDIKKAVSNRVIKDRLKPFIESKGGLDLEVEFFKLNAKVNSLNDDILTASTLKEQYELLKEQQIFNTQKINELFDMLELKFTKEAVKEVVFDDKENEKKAYQIYTDGRNQFIAGDYDEAIALFKSYLDSFPNYKNVADAKLWLGRAYFANELYSQSKAIYLEFQSENPQHAKYPDSMYELSRVLFELGELDVAKKMLTKMIEKFPTHDLYKKAKQMLTELEELTIDA